MNYDKDDWRPRPVDSVFPRTRVMVALAQTMKCCVNCAGEAEFFADDLSKRDYDITGLCQSCQDRIYQEVEDILDGNRH